MLENDARERIMVALDVDAERALGLARALAGRARWLKVGMTLYYREGPAIVRALKDLGFKVFLDLKLHDIPHQVAGAARSAALSGADLITVHGLGGAKMVSAALEGVSSAADELGCERARVIAVTVLTSMDEEALASIGVGGGIGDEAERLALLSRSAGADGIVCSPREAARMRELLGDAALVVTPGIRPAGAALGDQSRVATPAAAIAEGSSHLVIGRPVTSADDPLAAYEAIVGELASGA